MRLQFHGWEEEKLEGLSVVSVVIYIVFIEFESSFAK